MNEASTHVNGEPRQEEKKRNVFRVPTDEQVIPPGEVQQLIVKSDMAGTILGVVVGPNAKPIKLYAGRESVDAPDDVVGWRPNTPIQIGKFIILTVKNIGDEPAVFRALFLIDAPNHKVVVGPPTGPAGTGWQEGLTQDEIQAAADRALGTQQAQVVPRQAAPLGLTQALPPGPQTTPIDHGVKPTMNKIAIVLNMNEAIKLVDLLRNTVNLPLVANVKHGVIRRIEDALKAKK